MAPSSTNKPSFVPLEIKPIDFSLTAGTDIPAPPPESPPATPGRPPTPGRGPLSSHPTSPHDTSSDDPMAQTKPSQSSSQSSTQSNGPANGETRGRTESVATANTKPGSPGSKNVLSPTPTTESISSSKRPSSVRRFFGFRSASSSDSLRHNRPTSPQGSAPSNGSTTRPGLRERRKSGSWFNKRASTMFGSLAEVGEISNGSAIHEEQKPERKGPPPPKLPDLKKLGTDLNDGSLGADDMFKHIK
ncbi:uncharacterized protein BKCO1_2000295 [Diplodia corticola]|uniref:Uncharacterized protein n=1 Tax=Diplodia corticola TaxID=236234 RepID=A0A1J9RIV0_9PEZI|nr:uncharacterized protein BKCO1_2000295 [Diplodia corticola]OJD39954.1 hypothetical protein BKCO1_2000295 [Diplodia corticola]